MNNVGLPNVCPQDSKYLKGPQRFKHFPVEARKCKHLQWWSLKAEHIMVPMHLQISTQPWDPDQNRVAQDPWGCPLWHGIRQAHMVQGTKW